MPKGSYPNWTNKPHYWTAFGETKSNPEWAADPRFSVCEQTLRVRILRFGWSPEKALTTPVRGPRLLTGFGETKNLRAWSFDARCVVDLTCLHRRLGEGMPLEAALTTPISKRGNTYPGFGEEKTIREWAADPRLAISASGLRKRLDDGMTIEQCVVPSHRLPKKVERYEGKTLAEWVRDPRCRVGYRTLFKRIEAGWDFQTALTCAKDLDVTEQSAPVTAFQETKTASDWLHDPRCKVGDGTLRQRLRDGWDPEVAISSPPTEPERILGFGEWKTWSEWERDPRAQATKAGIKKRMSHGLSFEEALTLSKSEKYTPRGSVRPSAYGQKKTIREWAKDPRCEVTVGCLRKRLAAGTPLKHALKKGGCFHAHRWYEAWGEVKLMCEWARDPRCLVSQTQLRSRLLDGEDPEEAMSRPAYSKLKSIWDVEQFKGDGQLSLEKEALRFKPKPTTLRERLERWVRNTLAE